MFYNYKRMINRRKLILLACIIMPYYSIASEPQNKYYNKYKSLSNNHYNFSYSDKTGNGLLKLQKKLNIKKKKKKKKQKDSKDIDYKKVFTKAFSKHFNY